MKTSLRIFVFVIFILLRFNSLFSQKNTPEQLDSLLKFIQHYPKDDSIKIDAQIDAQLLYWTTNPELFGRELPAIIKKANEIHYKRGEAAASVLYGQYKTTQYEYSTAIIHLDHALQLATEIKDTVIIIKGLMRYASVNSSEYGNNPNADNELGLQKLEQARKLAMTSPKYNLLLQSINQNIALNLLGMDRPAEGIPYLLQGLDILLKSKESNFQKKHNAAFLYNLLGRCYSESHNPAKAYEYFSKALPLADEYKNLMLLIILNTNMGRMYLHEYKDLNAAKPYFLKTLELSKKGYRAKGLVALEHLKEINALQKNYKEAYQYAEQFIQLKDSIVTLDNAKNFQELQVKYETVIKDSKIMQLEYTNEKEQTTKRFFSYFSLLLLASILGISYFLIKVSKLNKKANKAINERDRLFSIVAHEIKKPAYNLQSISNNIDLAIKNKDYDLTQKLLDYIQQATSGLYSLVDNLLIWTNAHQNKIKVLPSMFVIEHEILQAIQLSFTQARVKKIEVQYAWQGESTMLYADRIEIQTVIRNLVDNSIKFSYPNSKIRIETFQDDTFFTLKVKDNGIGIPPELQKDIFKEDFPAKNRTGTSGERSIGMGLYVSYELAKSNNSILALEHSDSKGSVFSLKIPLNIDKNEQNKALETVVSDN